MITPPISVNLVGNSLNTINAHKGASGVSSAIREERKLDLCYRDESENESNRRVLPLAIVYYVHAMLLVSWCELHNDFRHFRLDRVVTCSETDAWFKGQGEHLRKRWKLLESD